MAALVQEGVDSASGEKALVVVLFPIEQTVPSSI